MINQLIDQPTTQPTKEPTNHLYGKKPLLKKLTVHHLINKLTALYKSHRSITVLTTACHWSLTPIATIHSLPSHFFKINFNVIFPYTPRSSKWFLSFLFPPHNPVFLFSSPLLHATCSTHLILHDYITWRSLHIQYNSRSSSLCNFLQSTVTSPTTPPLTVQNIFLKFPLSVPQLISNDLSKSQALCNIS